MAEGQGAVFKDGIRQREVPIRKTATGQTYGDFAAPATEPERRADLVRPPTDALQPRGTYTNPAPGFATRPLPRNAAQVQQPIDLSSIMGLPNSPTTSPTDPLQRMSKQAIDARNTLLTRLPKQSNTPQLDAATAVNEAWHIPLDQVAYAYATATVDNNYKAIQPLDLVNSVRIPPQRNTGKAFAFTQVQIITAQEVSRLTESKKDGTKAIEMVKVAFLSAYAETHPDEKLKLPRQEDPRVQREIDEISARFKTELIANSPHLSRERKEIQQRIAALQPGDDIPHDIFQREIFDRHPQTSGRISKRDERSGDQLVREPSLEELAARRRWNNLTNPNWANAEHGQGGGGGGVWNHPNAWGVPGVTSGIATAQDIGVGR